MATHVLLDLRRCFVRQQHWLEARWRATSGDPEVVMHLLRLWADGLALTTELSRRSENNPS
jgi:hypothetical protein